MAWLDGHVWHVVVLQHQIPVQFVKHDLLLALLWTCWRDGFGWACADPSGVPADLVLVQLILLVPSMLMLVQFAAGAMPPMLVLRLHRCNSRWFITWFTTSSEGASRRCTT